MKYWITCSVPGVYADGEIEDALSLEDARAVRDALNEKCEGGPGFEELWIIIDEDGRKVE